MDYNRLTIYTKISTKEPPITHWTLVSGIQMINQLITNVVYFDQQTHACAYVCMVENNQKHSKVSKKVLFSSCTQEAHVRLTRKAKKKVCWSAIGSDSQKRVDTQMLLFLLIFKCFWSFWTMRIHAQACVCWLKYTTYQTIWRPNLSMTEHVLTIWKRI